MHYLLYLVEPVSLACVLWIKWTIQRNWQHRVHKTKTNKTKKKTNTICVGHPYAQTNTNNVNKTWTLIQPTGGKDEPNIVFIPKSGIEEVASELEMGTQSKPWSVVLDLWPETHRSHNPEHWLNITFGWEKGILKIHFLI